MVINISEYYCKDDWKFKVYKPSKDNYDINSPEWISMKVFLLIQQKNKCARCKKILTTDSISVHHIIPRAEGGTNDIKNIIGLCVNCHDIIEPRNLKREDITKYHKRRKLKKGSTKNDWHLWVYGGFSRFLKNEKRIIIEEREEEVKYSYPENVVLHKEIFGKETIDMKPVHKTIQKTKKVKIIKKIKYNKILNTKTSDETIEELKIMLGVSKSIICRWFKDDALRKALKLYIEKKYEKTSYI